MLGSTPIERSRASRRRRVGEQWTRSRLIDRLYASAMPAYSGARGLYTLVRKLTAAMVELEELRARRRALGLTQAALADRLGVSTNTVARWERGEQRARNPRAIASTLEGLGQRHHALSSRGGRSTRVGDH